MGKHIPLPDRIRRQIIIDERGCWIWQGRPMNAGYGQLGVTRDGKTRTILAHRASYETFVGPIPDGRQLDHLCRVRLCVNPSHLEPVTPRQNIHRSPIAPAAINARKTHCPKGHPYTPENTYFNGPRKTWRLCRTCQLNRPRSSRSES